MTGVDIGPVNDPPVITSPAAFTVDENQQAVGTVVAIDPDRESGAPQGITYSLADGVGAQDNARFAIDAANGQLRFVTAGDYEDPTHAPSYSVRVRATDSGGSSVDQVVTVALRDVNEAPVAQLFAGSVLEDGTLRIVPQYSDPDAGDTLQLTFSTQGTVGNVTQDAQGFVYNPAGRFEALPAGVSTLDRFTYTVTDSLGHTATQTVTVRVDGQNDAATITGGSTAGSLTDEAGPHNTVLTTSGQLAVSDIDSGEAGFAAATTASGYGTFNIDAAGQWSYTANDALLQSISAGRDVVEHYTARSIDGTASADVAITLHGTNDAPLLAVLLGSIVQAGGSGTPGTGGTSTVFDVDQGDTHVFSGSAAGQYGSFAVDAASGVWTYTLDTQSAATRALGAFSMASDNFTLTVTDGAGAIAQAPVNVIIQGANDAPVVAGGDVTGTVHESAPDGKLILASGAAWGEYEVTADPSGRLAVLGAPIPASGGQPVGGVQLSPGKVVYEFAADGQLATSFRVDETAMGIVADNSGFVVGKTVNFSSAGPIYDFTATRYSASGSIDTGFGDAGTARVDFGGADALHQLLRTADGKLLLAGDVDTSAGTEFGVARLNADGSVDTGFGSNGKVIVTRPDESTGGWHAAAGADGSVVAWNEVVQPSGAHELHMVRLAADGSVDTGFGAGGFLNFSIGDWYANRVGDVLVDSAGRIVVGWGKFDYDSAVGYRPMLTRLNADGTPDASFGAGGTADTQVGTQYGVAFSLALDAQDRVLLTAHPPTANGDDFMLARFNADGSRDASFGTAGVVLTDLGNGDTSDRILPLAGGDIMLAGHAGYYQHTNDAAFVRYEPDGSLDAGFGGPPDDGVGGWLTASDPDSGARLSWSGDANGTYGSFTMNPYGSWSYTLDNSRPATQALSEGQTVTDTFTATVHDEFGATATQQIVITVVGAYDPPVT